MVIEAFTPHIIPGTQIEIIRPFNGGGITRALFDFDGTLSRERDGWIDIMVATNFEAVIRACPQADKEEVVNWVIRDIEETIGIPTYLQMVRSSEEIQRRGGKADPSILKANYVEKLMQMVNSVHHRIAEGSLSLDEVRVKGSLCLLTQLQSRLGVSSLYLASGTDIGPIKESVELLGFGQFFHQDRIIAAGSVGDPRIDAKELIINELVREQELAPGELLTIGDGRPELEYTNSMGGICVGVLTPDSSKLSADGCFTLERKRERLIKAGAHILVPDFSQAEKLIEIIFSNQV